MRVNTRSGSPDGLSTLPAGAAFYETALDGTSLLPTVSPSGHSCQNCTGSFRQALQLGSASFGGVSMKTLDCFHDSIRTEIMVMEEREGVSISALLSEAERRLRSLSSQRLRVANDFLAYLQEREENEATAELLSIPSFEAAFMHAVEQADSGHAVRFEDIRRDV